LTKVGNAFVHTFGRLRLHLTITIKYQKMNRSLAAVACLATLAIAHAAPLMEASIFEVDVTPTECVSCVLKGEHTRPFSKSVFACKSCWLLSANSTT
jgi:hypothetical protein